MAMTIAQLQARQKGQKNPSISAVATVEDGMVVVRFPATVDMAAIRAADTEKGTPLASVVCRKANGEPGTAYVSVKVKDGADEAIVQGRIGTFNLFL